MHLFKPNCYNDSMARPPPPSLKCLRCSKLKAFFQEVGARLWNALISKVIPKLLYYIYLKKLLFTNYIYKLIQHTVHYVINFVFSFLMQPY